MEEAMKTSYEEIKSRFDTIRPGLMNKKNVVATGIGYKTVNGKLTSDLAIVCSVESKISKDKLKSNDIIPLSIQDIPTDVNQTGLIRAFREPTYRMRPAHGGCSIGHYQTTAGTLGCLVKRDGELYILSNNHVIANSNSALIGDIILQPGPYDGGSFSQDQIAVLSKFVPIIFEEENGNTSCRLTNTIVTWLNFISGLMGRKTRIRAYKIQNSENKTDCAIAKPFNQADVTTDILQIGTISGYSNAELGLAVKKSGRTTGFTDGLIGQVDVTSRVSYGTNKTALFTDQLLAGAMSQGGDSGSAVLDHNNNIVGLLFAGSESTTLINRITNVFNELGVELP